MTGALLAFSAASVIAMAWGMQLESIRRTHPPVERYAGAAAVVAAQQSIGADHDVLLGEPMVRFHQALARRAERDADFHFHYVTTREMYNLARAAEAGWTGTVARLMHLFASMTPEELKGVFRVLLLRAQTGHLPSMKLLFAYTLGKPAEAVDPDEVLDERRP